MLTCAGLDANCSDGPTHVTFMQSASDKVSAQEKHRRVQTAECHEGGKRREAHVSGVDLLQGKAGVGWGEDSHCCVDVGQLLDQRLAALQVKRASKVAN